MGNTQQSDPAPAQPLRTHVLRTQQNRPPRSAVILGATGATGKFMLSFMIQSTEWSKVSIIHRRKVDLDAIATKCNVTFTEEQKSKVTQHVIDMEKMCAIDTENEANVANNVELFKGHDVVFCALGTKRAIAGTAENFKKVDLYMVRDAAILSKKAGVPHFSLLSSKGSNANMWANDWKITHGLLYMKVKGDAEQAVIAQNFARCSIFRPGVLGREGESGGIMGKLPVRDLAAVMMYDAESDDINKMVKADAEQSNVDDEKESKQQENEQEKPIIYESTDINNVLVLAQKNFDAGCGAVQTESAPPMSHETESKEKDDPEQKNDEEQKNNEDDDADADADEQNVNDKNKHENQAETETENNDDIEVVDKPVDDNSIANDNDYVDVKKE